MEIVLPTISRAVRVPRTAVVRTCALGIAFVIGAGANVIGAAPAVAETASPPVSTSWLDYYFNNKGIGSDTAGDAPNLDGNKAFHRANLNAGGAAIENGLTVGAVSKLPTDPTLTYVTAGGAVGQYFDNIEANGQTIDTSVALGSDAARPATRIGLVWTAHNAGSIAGVPTFTLRYADGTTGEAQLPAADWCSDGNANNVPVAARKPRYGDNVACTIFASQPIALSGVLDAITLPKEARVHIFAIASDADTSNALSLSEAEPTLSLPGTVRVGDVIEPPTVEWGASVPATVRSSWVVGGAELGWGATSRTVVAAGWLGKTLTYSVRGSTAGYAPTGTTSADAVTVAPGLLRSTVAPTLAGLARAGDTLVLNTGLYATDSDDSTAVGTAIEWLADGKPIAGASRTTFIPTTAQVGKPISARVTVTKTGYTTLTLTTAATAAVLAEGASPYPPDPGQPGPVPVQPAPLVAITRPASLSGATRVGAVLTTSPGTFSPASATVSYQWLRGASAIRGATSRSYRLVPADLGSTVSVRVTAVAGGRQPVVQLVTAGLGQPGTITASRPSITLKHKAVKKARVKVGVTLAIAQPTPTAYGSTVKLTYQWYAGSKKVSGNAGKKATLKVTKKLRGKQLSVKVSYAAKGYLTRTISSAKTSRVR